MARRKITTEAAPDGNLGGLPKLSAARLTYVMARAEGMTQAAAYRHAYAAGSLSGPEVWRRASELEHHPEIRPWIDHIQASAAEKGGYTLTRHVDELQRLKRAAEASHNLGAAVQAEQLTGKALGFYVEKHEDVTPRADELLTRARALMGDEWLESEQGKRLLKRVEH